MGLLRLRGSRGRRLVRDMLCEWKFLCGVRLTMKDGMSDEGMCEMKFMLRPSRWDELSRLAYSYLRRLTVAEAAVCGQMLLQLRYVRMTGSLPVDTLSLFDFQIILIIVRRRISRPR